MQGLIPETGGFEALSHLARKVCQASSGVEGLPPEEMQKPLWRQFFSAPTLWRDNRRRKPTPRHPDFEHKESKVGLWLDNRHKPTWVDSQLATLDSRTMKSSPEPVSTSVKGPGALSANEGCLEVTKLCDNGQMTDAVNTLINLVQRGCYVPRKLFYHVLKRCISDKDLVLGRQIHALTVESGYEGNDFLATQQEGRVCALAALRVAGHI